MTETLVQAKPTTVAEIIKANRIAQRMTLREFGDAVGVSYNAIAKFEAGEMEPGKDTVANWFNHETGWVYEMAKEIFVARYRASLVAVRTRDHMLATAA